MPLARYAVYEHGPQIWVAPTADDSDGWLASMRHIAIESGAFVVSVPQYIPAAAFPDDFPVPLPEGKDGVRRRRRGDHRARAGEVIAGPLYGEEGIVVADCDLRAGLHAKRWFDAVGHYSRAEVLATGARGAAPADGRRPRREPRRRLAPATRAGDGAAIAYGVLSDGPIDLVFITGIISHVEVLLEEPGRRADARAHRRVRARDHHGPPRHRAVGPSPRGS